MGPWRAVVRRLKKTYLFRTIPCRYPVKTYLYHCKLFGTGTSWWYKTSINRRRNKPELATHASLSLQSNTIGAKQFSLWRHGPLHLDKVGGSVVRLVYHLILIVVCNPLSWGFHPWHRKWRPCCSVLSWKPLLEEVFICAIQIALLLR